jgi:hypothetical protein
MCAKISCIEFVRSCYMRLFRKDASEHISQHTQMIADDDKQLSVSSSIDFLAGDKMRFYLKILLDDLVEGIFCCSLQ